MDRYAAVFMIVGAWLIGVALIARLIIPALINSHNDGAIILAVVFGVGTAISPFLIWSATKAIFQEQDNEN